MMTSFGMGAGTGGFDGLSADGVVDWVACVLRRSDSRIDGFFGPCEV